MIKGRYAAISAPTKSISYILNNDLQTHQTTQKHGLYYRSGHFVDHSSVIFTCLSPAIETISPICFGE
ncbi:hypothetical protein D0O17_15100 [Salmonella enterica]|nr:hypothetical protein [Salmonella enterica]